MRGFGLYLSPATSSPPDRAVPEIAAEAVAGGIWQVLHHYIEHDSATGSRAPRRSSSTSR